jgi:hypothetical protein
MPGTHSASSLLSAVVFASSLVACGGAPPPSQPAAPPASPSAPPEAASAPAPSAKAGSPPAATSPGAWPFGPAQTNEERTAQLDRLSKDAGPIKSNWVPPGKSERYGHAEGLVPHPVDAVRAKLVDYPHFKDLAGPKFKKVNVVDKTPNGTDVYFQLPIMKGLVTIWYVTRFAPPRAVTGVGDVIEGTFVKGNIKDMHIVFTTRPGPDDKSTVLVCDLVLTPGIPAPQSALDEELRDACGDALNAVKRTLSPPP